MPSKVAVQPWVTAAAIEEGSIDATCAGVTSAIVGGLAEAAAGDSKQSRTGMGQPACTRGDQLTTRGSTGLRCGITRLLRRLPGAALWCTQTECSCLVCMHCHGIKPHVAQACAEWNTGCPVRYHLLNPAHAQARDALADGAGKTVLGYLKGEAGTWDAVVRAYQSKGDRIPPTQSTRLFRAACI